MSQMPPVDFWNERFKDESYIYGERASRLLIGWSDVIASLGGKALVPACGEGRDAVYLAQLGLDVTAVDLSSEALRKTANLAQRNGVTVNTIEADLTTWDWPRGEFNVLAAMFTHVAITARPGLHARFAESLSPNGHLFIEGFAKDQISYQETHGSGGPPDVDMLFAADDIASDFSSLEPMSMMEGVETLMEGALHSGPAAMLRAVFKKN